jgi:hypothetical protein
LEKIEEEYKPFFKLGQLEVRFDIVTHERDELLKDLELALLYLDQNPLIKKQVESTIDRVKASIAARAY